ncbi:OadG family protein [Treponema pectinovorum]|uniref:OadG family protein n=1 Tax=Treponema pectinovorum TaxID=164 RepID=UPI0011F0D470|nr:OadG family protein [Treponema pectinovorum]
MTIGSMLSQSAILTLLGMCVVFGFLIIMIGCMNLLRIAVRALNLDKEETKTETVAAPATSVATDQKAVVAAIATALHNKN